MGEVADAVMAEGGRVIGVIPRVLAAREVAPCDNGASHRAIDA